MRAVNRCVRRNLVCATRGLFCLVFFLVVGGEIHGWNPSDDGFQPASLDMVEVGMPEVMKHKSFCSRAFFFSQNSLIEACRCHCTHKLDETNPLRLEHAYIYSNPSVFFVETTLPKKKRAIIVPDICGSLSLCSLEKASFTLPN